MAKPIIQLTAGTLALVWLWPYGQEWDAAVTLDAPGRIPITEIQHLQKHDDPVVTMTACQAADHTFFFLSPQVLFVETQLNVAAEPERKFPEETLPAARINVTDCNFTVHLGHRNEFNQNRRSDWVLTRNSWVTAAIKLLKPHSASSTDSQPAKESLTCVFN